MLKVISINDHVCAFALSLSSIFINEHWILFLLYLLLNIIDTITGLAMARIKGTESSVIGLIGPIKKVCSWFMILVAFTIPLGFQELGKILSIDLSVTIFLGWFVLASLILNEYRSILENLVGCECHVPNILIKGLEIVTSKLDSIGEENE